MKHLIESIADGARRAGDWNIWGHIDLGLIRRERHWRNPAVGGVLMSRLQQFATTNESQRLVCRVLGDVK